MDLYHNDNLSTYYYLEKKISKYIDPLCLYVGYIPR